MILSSMVYTSSSLNDWQNFQLTCTFGWKRGGTNLHFGGWYRDLIELAKEAVNAAKHLIIATMGHL